MQKFDKDKSKKQYSIPTPHMAQTLHRTPLQKTSSFSEHQKDSHRVQLPGSVGQFGSASQPNNQICQNPETDQYQMADFDLTRSTIHVLQQNIDECMARDAIEDAVKAIDQIQARVTA